MLQLNKKNKMTLIDLVDDVLDENNPFNGKIKTEDIYLEDNLFDDNDSKDIKKVSDNATEDVNLNNDVLFVDLAKDGLKREK